MKRLLALIAGCLLLASNAYAVEVVNDDFSGGALDSTVWNDGGGFFYSSANENLLVSSFSSTFGKIGDGSGAAGLNSDVGYASFTVTDNGVNPLGGNFQIAKDNFANTANALVRVNFADPFFDWAANPVSRVEVVWNNSTDLSPQSFATDSGWTGTISGNSSVVIIDEDPMTAQWQVPANRPNVDAGDAANQFGFWIGSGVNAVVDNVLIRDTLLPPDGQVGDFDGDNDVDGQDFLTWQVNDGSAGGLADFQNNYPVAGLAAVSAVPEPTSLVLILTFALCGVQRRSR